MRIRAIVASCGVAAFLWVSVPLFGATAVADEAAQDEPAIQVLSSRPDVVSGSDALLGVDIPAGVTPQDVRIEVDGKDVTDNFRPTDDQRLTGVVSELAVGDNTVRAITPDSEATLRITNHPRTGPVFAGPHQEPFICDTESFTTVVGDKLGPPVDEHCSVDTRVDYVYRNTADEFVPLPDGNDRPADLTWTTTMDGREVPFIVRVETGTVNRAIYETSILHDPSTEEPTVWQRPEGWNGRLIYTFGGGCPNGWYVQGQATGGVLDPVMLGRGYAIASSTLNVFGNNCNDLLAAESMSMVKERFGETYGEEDFTIGWGCSGGAYQNHQIADNYPGLLDGVISGCSFPDVGFGTVHTITDARLLDHYFREVAPGLFTQEQQRAVSGFGRWESIANLAEGGGRIDPRLFCPERLPEELRYDPETNPTGARCDVYDHTVNVYGKDPQTGFARRPLDNVGIQYGLGALRDGVIDLDQFIDLNERIGGFDQDANHVARRTVADPAATEAAYASGRMLNGGGGLADIPIIDHRGYTDDAANGDIHMRFQSFSVRERLREANGDADNQVMLVDDNTRGGFSTANPVLAQALTQLDQWIDSGTKPADLTDACWTRGANPRKIEEPQVEGIGNTRCNELYPVWTSPRMVAGGPTANDIVKCQLRPLDPADYPGATDQQRARLAKAFPDGVCDWSKPGMHRVPLAGTWQSF